MIKLNSLPDLLRQVQVGGAARALDIYSEDTASIGHLVAAVDGIVDVVARKGKEAAIANQFGDRVRFIDSEFVADPQAYDVVVVSPTLGKVIEGLRDIAWRGPRLLRDGGVWITFGIDPKTLGAKDYAQPSKAAGELFRADFGVTADNTITQLPPGMRGRFELASWAPRKPIYRSYLSWMAFRMLADRRQTPRPRTRIFTDERAHSLIPGLPDVATVTRGAELAAAHAPDTLMVVDNEVLRDARVVKTAETVRDLGRSVLLIGIAEVPRVTETVTRGGVPVLLYPSPRVELERRLRLVGGPLDQGVRRELRMAAFSRWLTGVMARLDAPGLSVHSHDFQSIYVVGAALEVLGRDIPWVHDSHEFIADYELVDREAQAVGSLWEQHYIGRPFALTCVSEEQASRLKSQYGVDVAAVIYNTQRLTARHKYRGRTLRQRLELTDETLLVHSGSVREGRGIEHLVRVMPDFPNVHLALITASRGPFVNSVLNEAKALGVRERVHMSALLPFDEVAGFIADADAGVIPMDSYGNAELSLPNKIFDYLLAGLPVLSSSTGALKRLFDEWPVGPMYPPGDESGLRAALTDLIAHRERYVAAINARPDLLVKHGWEAQAVKLQQIYDRLPLARQGRVR